MERNRGWCRIDVDRGRIDLLIARCRCGWSIKLQSAERKDLLNKGYVTRENNTPRHWIVTAIAFSAVRIAKKNARKGSRCEFVRSRSSKIRVAKATKYPKNPIIWYLTVKKLIRSGEDFRFARSPVEEVGGGG
jgi:hypothetical protein